MLILCLILLTELTLEKVEAFIPQILSKVHIECLIHGNADKQVRCKLQKICEIRIGCGIV